MQAFQDLVEREVGVSRFCGISTSKTFQALVIDQVPLARRLGAIDTSAPLLPDAFASPFPCPKQCSSDKSTCT